MVTKAFSWSSSIAGLCGTGGFGVGKSETVRAEQREVEEEGLQRDGELLAQKQRHRGADVTLHVRLEPIRLHVDDLDAVDLADQPFLAVDELARDMRRREDLEAEAEHLSGHRDERRDFVLVLMAREARGARGRRDRDLVEHVAVRAADAAADLQLEGKLLLLQLGAELGWQADDIARVEVHLRADHLHAEAEADRRGIRADHRQIGQDGEDRVAELGDIRGEFRELAPELTVRRRRRQWRN